MTDELEQALATLSTPELIAVLREHDLDQWRPEVFPQVRSLLIARGVDVTFLTPSEPPEKPVPSFEALAVAQTFGDALRANLCRMALQEAGIAAWLSTEHLAGVHPPLGLAIGVAVLVRPGDLSAAKQILEALARGEAELPEESEICPRCGALHTVRERRPDRLSTLSIGMPVATWTCRCPACGHEWQ